MIYKHKNKQIKLPKGMLKMQITWAVAWSQDSYLTIPHSDGEQAVIPLLPSPISVFLWKKWGGGHLVMRTLSGKHWIKSKILQEGWFTAQRQIWGQCLEGTHIHAAPQATCTISCGSSAQSTVEERTWDGCTEDQQYHTEKSRSVRVWFFFSLSVNKFTSISF